MKATCFTAAAVALFLVTAHSFDLKASSSLTFDEAGAKNRPVSKVVALLKDMLKQLEKEAEEDEEIYDKLACWCETNDKEKTKAIADAEARIARLTTSVEELTAQSARLNTEIENLEKEVAANQASLDKATAIRTKELAEFNSEEKDMLESISALKSAIVVLSKHHSFMQVPHSHVMGIAASIQHEMQKHASLLVGVLTHRERQALAAFVQAPQDYFDAAPTFKQSYAPQSGEVFGILKQMKETFESNLSASQKEEMASQAAYDEVKKAKEAEIAAGAEQIEKKTMELAITDEKNAQAAEDLADTKASLSADEKFLMMLKEKCASTDKEYEERKATRAEETKAVSKALAILSSDDAHDLFTKTFNPALLEKASSKNSQRRAQASKLLSGAAQKLHSAPLAALAVKVRLDAFTQVKKAIDDMIAQLLEEKAAEIQQKDFCIAEFDKNTLETEKQEREKAAAIAKIDDLEVTIKMLTESIDTLKADIAEMAVQLKRGSEDREKENKEFQLTIADQRATQQLLVAALKVLKGFYAKEAAFVQQEPVGPAPPPGFDAYVNNEKSGGVMGMIQTIIDEAKAVEKEAIVAEADSQKAYEGFVKETWESTQAKSKDIVDKSESKAKAESDLVIAKDAKSSAEGELEALATYKGELHSSCDFVLKNFEIRQTARDEEVEALKQAKSILSGANFQAFLQG
mmetsp:Transcript_157942/g.274190  ORF Transcript_157942/g.274190 Transcript_157942/m.274190 type:complete len:691 (-) Transcript_157942:83-2155(-)